MNCKSAGMRFMVELISARAKNFFALDIWLRAHFERRWGKRLSFNKAMMTRPAREMGQSGEVDILKRAAFLQMGFIFHILIYEKC